MNDIRYKCISLEKRDASEQIAKYCICVEAVVALHHKDHHSDHPK